MKFVYFIRNKLLILLQLLLTIFILFKYSNAIPIVGELRNTELIKRSELIVEGKFLESVNEEGFARFKIDSVFKGVPLSENIAVHFWKKHNITSGNKYLLLLNSRKDIRINIRKLYDLSKISEIPLYGKIRSIRYPLGDEKKQEKDYALKWLIHTAAIEDEQKRRDTYRESFESSNKTIQKAAKLVISSKIIKEIKQLGSPDEKEKRCFEELTKNDNEFLVPWTIRFLTKRNSRLAFPFLLEKFKNMNSQDRYFRSYLVGLSNYKTKEVANVIFEKLKNIDKDPQLNLHIGEIVKILKEYFDIIGKEQFNDLINDVALKAEYILKNSNKYPNIKTYRSIIQIFKLSNEPCFTDLLLDFYRGMNQDRQSEIFVELIRLLGTKEDGYATAFLLKQLSGKKGHQEVLEALGKIGGDSITISLMEFIKENMKHSKDQYWAKGSAFGALGLALQKSRKEHKKAGKEFLFKIAKGDNKGLRGGAIGALTYFIKDAEVTEFLIENWEKRSYRSHATWPSQLNHFRGREVSQVFPFLFSIVKNPREDKWVKIFVLRILYDYGDRKAIDFMKEIAQKEDNEEIRFEAVRFVVMSNDKDKVTIYLNYLIEQNLLKVGLAKKKYFIDDELTRIYNSLLSFYKKTNKDISTEDKFTFIHILRSMGTEKAAPIFEVAKEDRDRYVKEESVFALEELKGKNQK